MKKSYDDPGAAGTDDVEAAGHGRRQGRDPMPARGRQPTDLQYCPRTGRLVAHPPVGAGPRPGRRGVGGPRLDGGEGAGRAGCGRLDGAVQARRVRKLNPRS